LGQGMMQVSEKGSGNVDNSNTDEKTRGHPSRLPGFRGKPGDR